MATLHIDVQRFSVTSSLPFESVVSKLEAAVSHPDMPVLLKAVAAAKTYVEVERLFHQAVGASGLMEFARFDIGAIMRKEQGPSAPHILRLMVGNALILKQMAVHVHEAASYAPVTILIDERPDGVHLSYDRMASYLAPYGNAQVLEVARALDAKVETLLKEVAE